MKLPEGSTKVLLVNEAAVSRNKFRSPHKTEPSATVLVLDTEGNVTESYRTDDVVVNGPVRFQYDSRRFLCYPSSRDLQAAYVTTAEVVIDGNEDAATVPAIQPPLPLKKPAKAKRAPVIITEETPAHG